MAEVSQTTSAATDVPEFLSDLDGGIFERKLSIAMSQVALKARNVRKFRNSNR